MARRRRRGEGSVFYSKSERIWIARVSLGVINGRRVTRKARAGTEPAAKRELERLLRAYQSDVDPSTDTLDAYLRSWLEGHRRVAASTLRSYSEHVETHISPLLGGIPVAKLRQDTTDSDPLRHYRVPYCVPTRSQLPCGRDRDPSRAAESTGRAPRPGTPSSPVGAAL